MSDLNPTQQDMMTYLEQFPAADINDKLLPANLREAMVQSDAAYATRVQDEFGHYHLMLLTSAQVHVAAAAGMTAQQYAAAKFKYGKR